MNSPAVIDRRVALGALGCLAAIAALTVLAALLGDHFAQILFAVAGAVALVGLIRPWVAIAAATVASSTFGWVVVGPRFSVFQVLVISGALGVGLVHRADVWSFARRAVRRPELLALAVFLGWLTFAAFVRRDAQGDLAYVRTYVGAALFLALVIIVARRSYVRWWVVGAILLGSLATALLGLAQIVSIEAFVSPSVAHDLQPIKDAYTRLGAPFGLSAAASNFGKDTLVGFILIIPLAAATWKSVQRKLKWVALASAGLLGLAVVMSGARSTWLGAVVGLACVAAIDRRRSTTVLAVAAIVPLVVCMLRPTTPTDLQSVVGLSSNVVRPAERKKPVIVVIRPGLHSVSTTAPVPGRRTAKSVELSDSLRSRLTKAGFRMIEKEPVFGIGPGGFRWNVSKYVKTIDIDPRPNIPAHNVLLEIWADSGTPALVAYLGFLSLVLIGLVRRRRSFNDRQRALAAGLGGAIVALTVTSLFHNYGEDNYLWVLCGLAISLWCWVEPQRSPGQATPPSAA